MGREFVAKDLRELAGQHRSKDVLYIAEPGSPLWENGYCESFNSKLRDEFLNGEILSTRSRNCACWPDAGASTTTPSGHTPRWVTDHRHLEAWLTNNTGHGEVETAMRFPLPHTPDGGYLKSETSCAIH